MSHYYVFCNVFCLFYTGHDGFRGRSLAVRLVYLFPTKAIAPHFRFYSNRCGQPIKLPYSYNMFAFFSCISETVSESMPESKSFCFGTA